MKRPETVSHRYLFKSGVNWKEYSGELEKYADYLEEEMAQMDKTLYGIYTRAFDAMQRYVNDLKES